MEEIKGNAGGSTFAEISKSAFRPIKFTDSGAHIKEAYGRICEPLFESIHTNSLLVKSLSAIRDELLPRLISGKIRIEEAEEALKSVIQSQEEKVA